MTITVNEPTWQHSLRRDLRESDDLPEAQVRYLVDLYYQLQDERIRAAGQLRSAKKGGEPTALIDRVFRIQHLLEDEVKGQLGRYAESRETGEWAFQIRGVGPVITAGLLAHIDITRATNPSKIWRFAGLDPSAVWLSREDAKKIVKEHLAGTGRTAPTKADILEIAQCQNVRAETLVRMATTNPKGKPVKLTAETLSRALARRPWNADLKTLCWKLGESFVKQSGYAEDDDPADLYCRLYVQRKIQETVRNEAGDFVESAAQALVDRNYGRDTDARLWYSGCFTPKAARQIREADIKERISLTKELAGAPGSGLAMLPPARVHARAKRFAVKVFLVHFWSAMYEEAHPGTPAPNPWVTTLGGHADLIQRPKL